MLTLPIDLPMNLLLHLGVTVLVFVFARQLGLPRLGAAAAALLFAIHPAQVEPVLSSDGQQTILPALLYVAALSGYQGYLENRRPMSLIATYLFGFLGMSAGPSALSLPFVLLLMDWFKGRGATFRTVLEKLPLLLYGLGFAWFTHMPHVRIPGENFLEGVLIWGWMVAFYLRQFLFPFISVPVYPLPQPVSVMNPQYGLSLVVLGMAVVILVRLRRLRWPAFSFLFYFLAVFCVSWFSVGENAGIVADRLLYIPGIALCLLWGLGAVRWRPFAVLLVVAVCGYAVTTYHLVEIRQDPVSLWEHQLSIYPDTPVALNNLATALQDEEEYQVAAVYYREARALAEEGEDVEAGYSQEVLWAIEKMEYLRNLYTYAIQLKPDYASAHYNLGNLQTQLGQLGLAEGSYRKAVETDPEYTQAYFRLGEIYRQKQDDLNAIKAYEQVLRLRPEDEKLYVSVLVAYQAALRRDPDNANYQGRYKDLMERYHNRFIRSNPSAGSYFNLGWLYQEAGNRGEAVAAYKRALELDPNNSDALYNLANLYKDEGDMKRAVEFYEKTIKADPKKVPAYLNLGNIFGRAGDYEKAKGYYRRAIAVAPDNARAYFNLAYAESFTGHLTAAADLYKKVIALEPFNAEAHYNLGNIYINLNLFDNAVAAFGDAITADPQHVGALVNLSVLSFQAGDLESALQYYDRAVLLGYKPPLEYLRVIEGYREERGEREMVQ
jgi:tetratricopeptide (TPR) repeat protein